MNVRTCRSVHLVGIGGINVSSVAKLLHLGDIRVTGSDRMGNEQTEKLAEMGISIVIGHRAEQVPSECELLIYSSAVPASNPEREEARRRGIREMNSFEFLGEWFANHKLIIVAGTHGKSTTTAMLGLILERAGLDPTVIVGSVVLSFSNGNLRIGQSDLIVIEGDEYAKHFLAFRPYGLILNNIELDHTDIFPTIEDLRAAFCELIGRVMEDGFIVANMEDANVREVAGATHIRLLPLNPLSSPLQKGGVGRGWNLQVPGRFNRMNASAAAMAARELGASDDAITAALESFTGIWRRFEYLGEKNGARVYSDYAHHPTAVAATLEAAHDAHRVLLCFQPHHRNRTKHLFLDFVTSFDLADVLILCEIYDVAGRDESEDADVSSKDLVDAIIRHDADRGVSRLVEYAGNPEVAVNRTLELAQPGDQILIMGAGDIDAAGRKIVV